MWQGGLAAVRDVACRVQVSSTLVPTTISPSPCSRLSSTLPHLIQSHYCRSQGELAATARAVPLTSRDEGEGATSSCILRWPQKGKPPTHAALVSTGVIAAAQEEGPLQCLQPQREDGSGRERETVPGRFRGTIPGAPRNSDKQHEGRSLRNSVLKSIAGGPKDRFGKDRDEIFASQKHKEKKTTWESICKLLFGNTEPIPGPGNTHIEASQRVALDNEHGSS